MPGLFVSIQLSKFFLFLQFHLKLSFGFLTGLPDNSFQQLTWYLFSNLSGLSIFVLSFLRDLLFPFLFGWYSLSPCHSGSNLFFKSFFFLFLSDMVLAYLNLCLFLCNRYEFSFGFFHLDHFHSIKTLLPLFAILFTSLLVSATVSITTVTELVLGSTFSLFTCSNSNSGLLMLMLLLSSNLNLNLVNH